VWIKTTAVTAKVNIRFELLVLIFLQQ